MKKIFKALLIIIYLISCFMVINNIYKNEFTPRFAEYQMKGE